MRILLLIAFLFLSSPMSFATSINPDYAAPYTAPSSGKNIENRGDQPVNVRVTRSDGSQEIIRIDRGQAAPLPSDATRVEPVTDPEYHRGDLVTPGMDESSQVVVSQPGGDRAAGPEVKVNPGNSVVVDPNRPGVLAPGTAPLGEGIGRNSTGVSGDEGKRVANTGSEPTQVKVIGPDGKEIETIVVQPGESVALPPGATRVDPVKEPLRNREGEIIAPGASENSQIMVVGDGREVGVDHDNSVSLDPNRPNIIRPTRTGPGDRSDNPHELAEQEGKTITNYGGETSRVQVVDDNGNVIETIEIKPGESVALPPGAVRVAGAAAETIYERGPDGEPIERTLPGFDENSDLVISGDGNQVPIEQDNSVALDPDHPDRMRPTRMEPIGEGYRHDELRELEGKTVTNQGEEVVTVDVYGPNGEVIDTIEVQPGENVVLPRGSTRVEGRTEPERDREGNVIRPGMDENSEIYVHGDGAEVRVEHDNSVSLNPNNPNAVRPTRVPVEEMGGDVDPRTRDRDQEDESISNQGNETITVILYDPNGQPIGELQIEPGENVASAGNEPRGSGPQRFCHDDQGNIISHGVDENSDVTFHGGGREGRFDPETGGFVDENPLDEYGDPEIIMDGKDPVLEEMERERQEAEDLFGGFDDLNQGIRGSSGSSVSGRDAGNTGGRGVDVRGVTMGARV